MSVTTSRRNLFYIFYIHTISQIKTSYTFYAILLIDPESVCPRRRTVCVCLGSGWEYVPHCPSGPLWRCNWGWFYLGMTAARRTALAPLSPAQTPSTQPGSALPDPDSAAIRPDEAAL